MESYKYSDLDNLDNVKLTQYINKYGNNVTARNFGSDVSSNDNLIAAGRLVIEDINKTTAKTMKEYLMIAGKILNNDVKSFIEKHSEELDEIIKNNHNNENNMDYLSAKKFYDTYLSRIGLNNNPFENIQQCYMRIAIQMYHKEGLLEVKKTYEHMSKRYYTHASPTIFNAGKLSNQMSSCFLLTCDDNTESILENDRCMGIISKNKGGIGLDLSRIRHSEIGTTGYSKGIVPLMYKYDATIRYFDQEGLRKGACTVYTRAHHIDLFEFCEASLKDGDHYARTHHLNTAIWFPWLFWKRVADDSYWSLFCPKKTSDLNDIYGIEFNKRYEEYEKEYEGNNNSTIYQRFLAKDVLKHIIRCQRKSGMPYIMHGDSCNEKSNQKHIGYIRSSNLCLEIIEYSSTDEIPSCNLASVSTKEFVLGKYEEGKTLLDIFDWDLHSSIIRQLVKNLNRVIDYNKCPIDKIKINNDKYRPLGIGLSGFADALYRMDMYFDHPLTLKFNEVYFASMYFNALAGSVNEAIKYGPYHDFDKSPAAKGQLQFDLWRNEYLLLKENNFINEKIRKYEDDEPIDPSNWNQKNITLDNNDVIEPTWNDLKEKIKRYGLRNSLTLAIMPTASTSTIMMNTETTEAPMSNLFERRLMNGSFPVINSYMEKDLRSINAWNDTTIKLLEADSGSIAKLNLIIKKFPNKYPKFEDWKKLEHYQIKYKTMWELSMRLFMDMAAQRGRYIDQSQSFNLYISNPGQKVLKAAHLRGHYLGLKTGMYYLRQTKASESSKITVEQDILDYINNLNDTKRKNVNTKQKNTKVENIKVGNKKNIICTDEICISCQ